MHIAELAKRIKRMRAGEEVELIVDSIGAREDVPAWCGRTGNELLGVQERDGAFMFQIRKKGG